MSESSQPSSENDGKCQRPHGSRRRQVHNEVERRRKDKINGWITKIGELLPKKDLNKLSKINILEQTVDYIKLLGSERDKLLSENISEVQAEEIKSLKKDLQTLLEQNALYERLLEQSNVTFKTLPKKFGKYSNKFERTNGVLTAKHVEPDSSTYVDCATQVSHNVCANTPVSTAIVSGTASTCENSKICNGVITKSPKTVAKGTSSASKPVKITPATTINSVVNSCATVSNFQSNSTVNATLITQTVRQSSNISQENVIPIISWNDPTKNSAHAGGVTTVLSQFPVMSTTLGSGSSFSNIYNKNVPTFIIPAGGNILQSFPTEKPSNTISIICPTTLPILVPQQVLNVPSVARNVGLPPTIICPGPADSSSSQVEKSNLGSALLTINPNPIVPISSSLSANTRIILPSQPTLLGNACGNVNLTHNFISPVLTAVTQNEDLIVPLVQKLPVSSPSKNVETAAATIDSSCGNESSKADSSEVDADENALETNKNISDVTPLPLNACIKSKITPQSPENDTNKRKVNQGKRSLCLNAPPSLQVLSANKIISLANQSQQSKKKALNKKINDKTACELLNKSKSNESTVSFCVQVNASSDQPTNHIKRNDSFESSKKNTSVGSDMTTTQTSSDISTVKSNFSLTVLMGDCLTDKNSPESSKSPEINNSFSQIQDNASDSEMISSPTKSVSYISNTVENVSFSNISESDIVFNVTKENGFESSVQVTSDTCSSAANSETEKARTLNSPNSKILAPSNENFSNNPEALGNLPATVNSSNVDANSLSNFNSLAVTNSIISASSRNVDTNVISKHNETTGFSSKNNLLPLKITNIMQNDQTQPNISSDIANSVNNSLNENVPYSANESSVNHSMLPSLFSSNQIVNINSPVLVCHTGQDNSSGILLPQNLQVSESNTTQNLNSCLLHYSHGDFQTFSVLPNSVASMSATNDSGKKSTDVDLNFPVNSGVSNISTNAESHKTEVPTENDCGKEFTPIKKKNKLTYREPKANLNDKSLSNSESTSELSSNSANNKVQTINTVSTFSKNDSTNCSRSESGFNYSSDTPDILARATETIFCNDILENPQITKRNESCFTDDVSHLNVNVATSEKTSDNYKIQYSHEQDHSIPEDSVEKTKKNISENNMLHSDVTNSHIVQNDNRNVQEINSKQMKFCKLRKSKVANDSEPPCKKLKEAPISEKSIGANAYGVAHQSNKVEKNISNVHSNLTFLEKQITSPTKTSSEDQNSASSIGNFSNQIHISDNSCKTPSSVDTIFSLTPMLGDILKDVSHNVSLDSRNTTFVTGNENQSVFSSEKNFIAFNYPNNSNEDYLNLPRMPFPIIPEISSSPVVHVTSVSFAHSVSLCSTQSDSQKTAETHASTNSQNKSISKKKDILPLFHNNHNILNLDLVSANNVSKQSECAMKSNDSDTHFNVTPTKATNSPMQFENQHPSSHIQSGNSIHPSNLVASQSNAQYNSSDNFITPASHSISFYPTISSSSNVQNFPCTTTSLQHGTFSSNLSNIGTSQVAFSASGNTTNSFSSQSSLSKPDNLSHSLCSLLKENSNIVENRGTASETSSQSTSSSSSSNVAQSKYSALSLISDQTPYSESISNTTCHSHFVQSSAVHTTSGSDVQFISTASSCSRNPKTSLSYSAESLLQTCANSEKNKNNKNNRFQLRTTEKKVDRNGMTNMHSIGDTNIFMPVSNCDINIQNAPLVPLPPVTSFHNFPSAYTVCDSTPSTTIFNSVSRAQDIPLSLSNDNFLNHINLNVESQMISGRHEVSSTVPKPHSSITLQFENPNSLYNNCSFLSHVKPALESSRSSETSACFQPSSYNNNYSQQSQKPNCCQFTHRPVAPNSDVPPDINLSVSGTVPSFHNEKNNFQPNRTGLQASFSQSNSNFMGNFFYNTSASCHDGNERNDLNVKPSTNRTSQEVFVPEGVRQSIHDPNTNVIFNSRKTTPSNRTKSKKPKNIATNENVNGIPTCISNYSSSQDNSCNKVNISYVPNGYFKSGSHPVLPSPGQIQCSQNKMAETVPTAVIPAANPSFNPVLHQQSDNFLNLNFQHPNFTMSPLPRPPTQPLSCSCLTTPIISHTFSSSTPHPVPNFNLSNILPDMGCSTNQVSFSPAKFPMNHSLSSSSTQCQTNSTITNSAHIVSHQSCAPSLYPPHPPMVRGTLNPILGPNSQSLIDSQVSLVATAGSVMSQNTTFTATQNPTFRNVIHPITFPRNDRSCSKKDFQSEYP